MIWEARFGEMRLYAISDGWFSIHPGDFLPGSDPEEWRRHPEHLDDQGRIRINLGCFLLIGRSTVMIDTGIGPLPPPGSDHRGGRLPEALGRLGMDPSEVEAVVHTHLHYDHFGGDLTPEGEPAFPSATYYVHRRELDHWTSMGGPVAERFFPLVEAGRVETVDGDADVAPGVTMVETPGHTPGHVSVAALSQGRRTYITGDVTHHPMQLRHPEWNVAADVDPAMAASTRRRMFDLLSAPGLLTAAGHYPPPGLGSIRADDGVRVFIPAEAVEALA